MRTKFLLLFVASFSLLSACASEIQTIEVTRLVNQEVPVEVTRLVTEVNMVEVTRLVEVVVTVPPDVVDTAVPAATPEPTPMPTTYIVQSGDNLSFIAAKTGVPAVDILAANNLTAATLLTIGQELLIPGWNGALVANIQLPGNTPAPAATGAPAQLVPTGANLLPNPSFEEGWYFFQGVSEWQIPNGWQMAVDEGANTLTPGDGGTFFRPEIRVVPKSDIPASEHAQFVFAGQNTIKAFKGGAPTSFAIFTDVTLPPGSYRLTLNFFADIVGAYNGGNKIWATQLLSSEARILVDNGGTEWMVPLPGSKTTITHDFTLEEAGTVRVGGAFRSRFVNHNNGWFLDDWSLQALGTP